MKFGSIKRKIAFLLNEKSILYKILEKINLVIFHWDKRMKLTHPGEMDEDKTYLVIRPQSDTEGLLSSYYYVVSYINWGQERGYICYVDFDSELCQYHIKRSINGTTNAWEYYFEQPNKELNRKLISEKKNVLYSGWRFCKQIPIIKKDLETVRSETNLKITREKLKVKPYILEIVKEKICSKFNGKSVLGVYIRGTDYVSLKPSGHPIQPNIEDVIVKIKEFLSKYEIDYIFIVTEDKNYYDKISGIFKDKIISSNKETFWDYKPGNYISNSFKNDPYERGLEYLVKMIMLTECDYLISSITNGSLFSYGLKEDEYIDSFWFNLGFYD